MTAPAEDTMKKLMALCAAVAMATGCGKASDDFKNVVPSSDNVKLNVPASATAMRAGETGQTEMALRTGPSSSQLQGDIAGTYQITRGVTGAVNLGTVFVLGLVKGITDQTPTTADSNHAVWGPYTDQLSPTTWKFTAVKTGDHTYSYSLEGKPKAADDSAYVIVLSGQHTPALDGSGDKIKDYGSGSFLIDWNEAQTLPEHDSNVGTAALTYSRDVTSGQVTIDVQFNQVRDENSGQLIDATYHFAQDSSGGNFAFNTMGDVDHDTSGDLENLVINSRWMSNGAGRSDVTATGGSVGSASFSECWNESFASTYLNASWDAAADYGTEGTDCVFTSAAFPGA
jgi:hypothetical protein